MTELLQSRILEELSYTDLDTTGLVRRVRVGVSKVKPELKRMEKAGLIKRVVRGDEEVWEAT